MRNVLIVGATSAMAIATADLSTMDDEARQSVEQILEWCTRSTELDRDLVCFYY